MSISICHFSSLSHVILQILNITQEPELIFVCKFADMRIDLKLVVAYGVYYTVFLV